MTVLAWRSVGAALVAAACFVGLGLPACDGSASPQVGGQTNWLKRCTEDADCGELSCWCGTCTRACAPVGPGASTDPGCGDLERAACVPTTEPALASLCGGSAPPVPLCLPRCVPGECGAGSSCVGGVCQPSSLADVTVEVTAGEPGPALVGFGAGLGFADEAIATHPQRDALYDRLFRDLGIDALRLRNRLSTEPMPDLSTTAEVVAAASERIGRPVTVLLTSGSPPAALKVNGSSFCSGNQDTCTLARLPDGAFDYGGFASYWRRSLQAYEAAGLSPDYLSIQNDPNWVPPADAVTEACRFLPTEGSATVLVDDAPVDVAFPGYQEALAAVKGAIRDLPAWPQVVSPDATGVEATTDFLAGMPLADFDVLGFHMYGQDAGNLDRDALEALGGTSTLPRFQTEMSGSALDTAAFMHGAMTIGGAAAYLHLGLADFSGAGQDDFALVRLTDAAFELRDTYHVVRHYARFTDPGWTLAPTTANDSRVLTAAWWSPVRDGLTVVLINPSSEDLATRLQLDTAPVASLVVRSVFTGTERFADQGPLPADAIVRLAPSSVTTVALAYQED